jgi:hypothetical protein
MRNHGRDENVNQTRLFVEVFCQNEEKQNQAKEVDQIFNNGLPPFDISCKMKVQHAIVMRVHQIAQKETGERDDYPSGQQGFVRVLFKWFE